MSDCSYFVDCFSVTPRVLHELSMSSCVSAGAGDGPSMQRHGSLMARAHCCTV